MQDPTKGINAINPSLSAELDAKPATGANFIVIE